MFLAADKSSINSFVWKQCEALFEGEKNGLFLHGPTGTGKTHLAVAVLRETSRPRPRFVSAAELMLSLRQSFRDRARFSEEEIIDRYSDECGVLVLDDLGVEKPSEFTVQSLNLIIERRYVAIKQTIITSNFSIGEIAERVGDRIASRIAGMCKVIELQGNDRRITTR